MLYKQSAGSESKSSVSSQQDKQRRFLQKTRIISKNQVPGQDERRMVAEKQMRDEKIYQN
jgi:hypothetical protein